MGQLNLFYKAFNEYKQHTASNLECKRVQKQSRSLSKKEQEDLVAVFATCTIEEDWIKAIEHGIPYILKAIKEERQFIRNDGEVLPIEKVRKTSKYSIQDLAKHSNYISHEPMENANTDVVPDKLLMIRKENDYTVYENRVVYATLIYLQEFIAYRLHKIKEITNKYEARTTINKQIIVGNRTLNFNLDLNEIIKDDPYAIKRNKCQDLIERMEIIYSNVVSLLRTPLMIEVSKVDVVNRPIVKTNVLKMDLNFKETLSLFDYIAEYPGDGFTVNVTQKSFNPFNDDIVKDYTEIMMLSSFITYMYANNLKEELHDEYQIELQKLKELEEEKILEKLKTLNLKAHIEGKTLNEYLLIMDEAVSLLEEKNRKLKQKISDNLAQYKKDIEEINQKHSSEISSINKAHEEELLKINQNHEAEINKLNDDHLLEINNLKEQNDLEISNLKETINDLNLELSKTKNECEETLKQSKKEYETKEKELIDSCDKKVNELQVEHDKAEAELIAIRLSNHIDVDPKDFTSKDRFNQLEREKRYLDSFYEKAWNETKKQIRKDVFSVKPPKKVRKKKNEEKQ